MKKKITGYTEGVFDLFHIGHLNHLKRAKKLCDILVVGVYSDKIVKSYKNKNTVIPHKERLEILKHVKFVDKVFSPRVRDDKLDAWNKLRFDILFIGDDWKGTERWKKIEKDLAKAGVKVKYLPYTKHISSSKIIEKIKL